MRLKYNKKEHSYWLDGKRCKGVTTLAKIPENTYNLEQWAKRQVAIGLAMRPDLVEAVAAHFDDRDELADIIEEAETAAKTQSGAIRGRAAHRVIERVDKGEERISTNYSDFIVRSWQEGLDAEGLEVVDEYIERIVVYPHEMIAGRYDRLLRRKADGRLVVADLKTGRKAISFPHPMSIQLGLYANAPLMCADFGDQDGETTEFKDMTGLDIDTSVGYIFHFPGEGEEEGIVAKLDIGPGWRIFNQAVLPILHWRDRDDLCAPLAPKGVKQLWAAGLLTEENTPSTPTTPTSNTSPTRSTTSPTTSPASVGWDEMTFDEPPKPSASSPDDTKRLPLTLGGTTNPSPVSTAPDEGDDVPPVDVEGLQRRYNALTPDQRAWADSVTPFSVKANPTLRRYQIARAIIRFASLDADDEMFRVALHVVFDADVGSVIAERTYPPMPTAPLKLVLAVLTLEEANKLNAVAVALHQGRGFEFTADGPKVAAA